MKRIAIVTSTRADWGLLSPIARRLADSSEVELQIIATNMHLDPRRGMTISEIEADGFTVDYRVEMTPESDTPADTARAMARCLDGMSQAFSELRPDLILILGDRYEMLAVASAATVMHIPIAHISGGEITEGAIDDNIRHAISKLSSLHFATTEAHRWRLAAMGEQPDRVINAGAIGVYNINNLKLLTREQLAESLGFEIADPTILVTYHVATNDPTDPRTQFGNLLAALDRFPDVNLLITYPNNDPGSEVIIKMIEEYSRNNPERVKVVPSLGRLRYLSALQFVKAVVGNSSSGIVEVPSARIPTVDIGIRQQGRTASKSVIHCDNDTDSIADAITEALSKKGRYRAQNSSNPYEKRDTLDIIANTLIAVDPTTLLPKKFYDIPLIH